MRHWMMVAALALPLALGAHEGELKKAAKQAEKAVTSAEKAVASAGKAVVEGAKDAKAAVDAAGKAIAKEVRELTGTAAEQVDPGDLLKRHRNAHWHNKVVHFPVALGLMGALFLVMALRWPSLQGAGRWMLFLAGLGGLAAIYTGGRQEGEFDGTSLVRALELHEERGKLAVGLIFGAWALSFFDGAKKWAWLVYLLLAGLIAFVAALGGAIAHS